MIRWSLVSLGPTNQLFHFLPFCSIIVLCSVQVNLFSIKNGFHVTVTAIFHFIYTNGTINFILFIYCTFFFFSFFFLRFFLLSVMGNVYLILFFLFTTWWSRILLFHYVRVSLFVWVQPSFFPYFSFASCFFNNLSLYSSQVERKLFWQLLYVRPPPHTNS